VGLAVGVLTGGAAVGATAGAEVGAAVGCAGWQLTIRIKASIRLKYFRCLFMVENLIVQSN
jgi:hypothetical protein